VRLLNRDALLTQDNPTFLTSVVDPDP
jgi:hypothetical protein